MGHNLYEASKQWASRPDDERFLDLASLHQATKDWADSSSVMIEPQEHVEVVPNATDADSPLLLQVGDRKLDPTNWSFGQLCQTAGVPANFVRAASEVSPDWGALNINLGMAHLSKRPKSTYYHMPSNGGDRQMLRAVTSEKYGRIYDHEVVGSVVDLNDRSGDRWVVPSASYSDADPLKATTLYASDRDLFIFLVDPTKEIVVRRPGKSPQTLFRGFFAWNSEVGAKTMGLMTFLYNIVCDNRIVWNVSNVTEYRLRHSLNAPERFAQEGPGMLEEYANTSAKAVEARLAIAAKRELAQTDEGIIEVLRNASFKIRESQDIVQRATEEEGQARTVWDLVQGGTAIARDIVHTDHRVDFERRVSGLLKLAN